MSKKSIFTFNGRASSDWNFYKTSPINFPSPVRDVESKPIPGRNGELTLDNGRYSNIEITIECWIKSDFRKYYDSFRGFLMQDSDYHRLEDDHYPDEFRMARVVKVEPNLISPAAGSIYITMSCKPQRFLKAGERPLPHLVSEESPISIMVKEGYWSSTLSADFIRTSQLNYYSDCIVTVLDTSAYADLQHSIVLHYSDIRARESLETGDGIKIGYSDIDPTAAGVPDDWDLTFYHAYNNVLKISIIQDYTIVETPIYYDIVDENDVIVGTIFPTSETIVNPTACDARPLLRFHYTAQSYKPQSPVCLINDTPITITLDYSHTVNSKSVTITDFYFDCETMDAYVDLPGYTRNLNWNGKTYAPYDIALKPGVNTVRFNNLVDYIEIVPRWWRL